MLEPNEAEIDTELECACHPTEDRPEELLAVHLHEDPYRDLGDPGA